MTKWRGLFVYSIVNDRSRSFDYYSKKRLSVSPRDEPWVSWAVACVRAEKRLGVLLRRNLGPRTKGIWFGNMRRETDAIRHLVNCDSSESWKNAVNRATKYLREQTMLRVEPQRLWSVKCAVETTRLNKLPGKSISAKSQNSIETLPVFESESSNRKRWHLAASWNVKKPHMRSPMVFSRWHWSILRIRVTLAGRIREDDISPGQKRCQQS